MRFIFSFSRTVLILVCLASIYFFCHKQTDGFAILKIRESFTDHSIPHLSPIYSDETLSFVRNLLNRPLTYLGRGGQCYAFATEDNQYVVKLLKYNNNYPLFLFRLCPFPFGFEKERQAVLTKKRGKLMGEYKSYQIALENLSVETGLLYFHLDQHTLPNAQLQLVDKLHILHTIPADSVQFYIQKKGTALYPEFLRMIELQQLDQAKQSLDEITAYLLKRCQKQITDKDDGIWRNFAFCEGHPFQIDIGQFCYDPTLISTADYQKNLLFFTKDFRNWLTQTEPSLAQYFSHTLETLHAMDQTSF